MSLPISFFSTVKNNINIDMTKTPTTAKVKLIFAVSNRRNVPEFDVGFLDLKSISYMFFK